MENRIDSGVSEILRYRQKNTLLLFIIGYAFSDLYMLFKIVNIPMCVDVKTPNYGKASFMIKNGTHIGMQHFPSPPLHALPHYFTPHYMICPTQ